MSTTVPGSTALTGPALSRPAAGRVARRPGSFPSPQVVLSCGSTGTTAASDSLPASDPLPGITGRTSRPGSIIRRLPGRGGPRQFPPPPSIRSAPPTPGGPSRLRFQALHRHGLRPDPKGWALPAPALTDRTLNDAQASRHARSRLLETSEQLARMTGRAGISGHHEGPWSPQARDLRPNSSPSRTPRGTTRPRSPPSRCASHTHQPSDQDARLITSQSWLSM